MSRKTQKNSTSMQRINCKLAKKKKWHTKDQLIKANRLEKIGIYKKLKCVTLIPKIRKEIFKIKHKKNKNGSPKKKNNNLKWTKELT